MPREDAAKLKDWFDREAAIRLAAQVRAVSPDFDSERYVRLASRGLQELEFKERVEKFAWALKETLPQHLPTALAILTESLPEPLPDCESPTDGWLQWPIGEFIALYGLPCFDDSFEAMYALTQRFTAEYAVRPFVEHYPEESVSILYDLVGDESPHVRRWCSEAVRPRLPWGKVLKALVEDPEPILPILEALIDDPELYVRRSVANNLNDISKDHPELVVDLCEEWHDESNEERMWVVRHALRGLIKAAHRGALGLLGFPPPPEELRARLEVEPSEVRIGEMVKFKATLLNRSPRALNLQVDFVLHLIRSQGASSGKVFKWKAITLEPGQQVTLPKKHPMKKTTVRDLYPGIHRVELQVNGVRLGRGEFLLKES